MSSVGGKLLSSNTEARSAGWGFTESQNKVSDSPGGSLIISKVWAEK